MSYAHSVDLAQRLVKAKGWDAGVHPQHGAVIYLYDRIWRIAGGDLISPSLIGLAGVRVRDVQWLTDRVRQEPVT